MTSSDVLEHGARPRPALRIVAIGVSVALVVAFVVVSMHRSADLRGDRASFDQLLTLTAAGEAAVERAQSQARDTANYAEPLLNSTHTPQAVRASLYLSVSTGARKSQADIDAQLQKLADASAGRGGRLRAAQAATGTYFSDWAAVFGSAAGVSDVTFGTTDLMAQQKVARIALQKAAPDRGRVLKASVVFGGG